MWLGWDHPIWFGVGRLFGTVLDGSAREFLARFELLTLIRDRLLWLLGNR